MYDFVCKLVKHVSRAFRCFGSVRILLIYEFARKFPRSDRADSFVQLSAVYASLDPVGSRQIPINKFA